MGQEMFLPVPVVKQEDDGGPGVALERGQVCARPKFGDFEAFGDKRSQSPLLGRQRIDAGAECRGEACEREKVVALSQRDESERGRVAEVEIGSLPTGAVVQIRRGGRIDAAFGQPQHRQLAVIVAGQDLGECAATGTGVEEQVDPAAAWQSNVEIGRPGAEADEPGLSVGERANRLRHHRCLDATAREGADISSVGGDRHLRPDRARRGAFDPGQRHQYGVDAFRDPRESEAQYVGGRGCYHDGIAFMFARTFEGEDGTMIEAGDICAILLAAGRSRRFGVDDKLLAPFAGGPLALHAAARITEMMPGRRIAVCPDEDGPLAQRLAAQGFEILANPDEALGMSRSLACGIAEAARGPQAAALICLADMPFVSLDHLMELLARFDAVHWPVVASTDGAAAMPPALFARSLFDRLQAGEGDRGGKALLGDAVLVRASASELADIDRPEDIPGA